jgi:hypothetical protein
LTQVNWIRIRIGAERESGSRKETACKVRKKLQFCSLWSQKKHGPRFGSGSGYSQNLGLGYIESGSTTLLAPIVALEKAVKTFGNGMLPKNVSFRDAIKEQESIPDI